MKRLLSAIRVLLSLVGLLWLAGPGLAQYGEITVQFSSPIYYVMENGGSMTIDVVLSAPSSNTVTVKYATADGTATAGADYTATSGTLTFAPGETGKTFAIPILPDKIAEDTETINLTLSEAVNATISPTQGTATVTITDVYTPPAVPTVEFTSDGVVVDEADGLALLKVSLSPASTETVTVDFATEDSTATSPDDYFSTTGTLVFAPGETEKQISIPITNDSATEYTEWAFVTLSNPQNAILGFRPQAFFSVIDNDGPPPPTMVGFEYSSFTVSEANGTATVTVLMTGAPTDSVSVTCATTTGGTATPGVDYVPNSVVLTWLPSEAGTTKTFTISIMDNIIIDGTRTVNLVLSDPVNATIGGFSTAVLNITDDDEPCPP